MGGDADLAHSAGGLENLEAVPCCTGEIRRPVVQRFTTAQQGRRISRTDPSEGLTMRIGKFSPIASAALAAAIACAEMDRSCPTNMSARRSPS
jgi:hypothetical protein